MPELVFRLRNVPDDESEDVRRLLHENNIEWYETTAGNWGIAMPALWVSRQEDVQQARQLIEQYQSKRSASMRTLYEQKLADGEVQSFARRIKQHPIRITGIILFCLFIVYVMINPFLRLIGYSTQ